MVEWAGIHCCAHSLHHHVQALQQLMEELVDTSCGTLSESDLVWFLRERWEAQDINVHRNQAPTRLKATAHGAIASMLVVQLPQRTCSYGAVHPRNCL